MKEDRCPQCHRYFPSRQSDSWPFCSEKCRMVDLGHWLTESYAAPLEEKEEDLVVDETNQDSSNL